MKYLGDVKEIDINSAKNNAELGIDIFNASSDFFNNICFQYKSNDGKDIVVNDRRSDMKMFHFVKMDAYIKEWIII